MFRVSTYLDFQGNTERAFTFYRSVFGGEFNGPIRRFGEVPAALGQPAMGEADKNLVMHVELPILGGHVLMGTDAPASIDFTVVHGNSVHINLKPDPRGETDRLFGPAVCKQLEGGRTGSARRPEVLAARAVAGAAGGGGEEFQLRFDRREPWET